MKVNDTIFNLARYLLELSLVNYRMIKFRNSNVAASALYLALKMTKASSSWNETISKHSHYKEQEIRQCAKDLFVLIQTDSQGNGQLQAVKKKFALVKYGEVSKIRLETSTVPHDRNSGRSLNTATNSYHPMQSTSSAKRATSVASANHRNTRSVSSASQNVPQHFNSSTQSENYSNNFTSRQSVTH